MQQGTSLLYNKRLDLLALSQFGRALNLSNRYCQAPLNTHNQEKNLFCDLFRTVETECVFISVDF